MNPGAADDPPPEADGTRSEPRGLLPFPLKHLGDAQQVVIVTSRSWTSTQAQLEAYQQGRNGWTCTIGPLSARVGRTGMVAGYRRMQDTGTTPAGTFTLSMAFGLAPDPGCHLPYQHVTSDDEWWVADPLSPHYNSLRRGDQGGFALSETGRRASERIAAHPAEYEHVLVVDFNRPHPARSRGSGIFVRVSTGVPTGGSVAIDRDALVALLCWLQPGEHPVIVIGPERSIAQY